MKRLRPLVIAFAALVTVASSTASPSAVDDLMIDMQITPLDPRDAPPFSVTTLDGGPISLADVRGHVVLVYFWATW